MSLRSVHWAGAEGALLSAVVGMSFALNESYSNHDLAHGMPWLAAMRTLSALRLSTLSGAAVSIFLLFFVHGLASRRLRALLTGLGGLVAVGTGLGLLFSGPWANRLHTAGDTGTSNPVVVLTLIGSITALITLRVVEGIGPRSEFVSPSSIRRALVIIGSLMGLMVTPAPELLWRLRALDSTPRPSVVLISLDTVRADRLGRTTSGRSLTPHLDALANEGASFVNATAPSPWTQPSHASVFTSLLPFDQRGMSGRHRVPPGLATLTERLRDAGYRTGAFTGGGSMHPSIGFHQGFEVYESHDEIAEGGPEGIFSDALGWLEGVQDRPYFLFLHTYEAHTPYTHTSVADPRQSGRIGVSFDYEDLAAVRQGELVMTAGERQYVEDLYDGDVAYADQALGRFLHQVDEITSLDKAVVVVFSDHGEDLWDHVPERSPDHGHSLYEELLMVPLIVRAPSVVAAGLRVQTPVSLLDVAPTLLSLLGMQPDGQYRGRDLSVTLRDGVEPAELPVFAESVHYGPDRFSVRRGRLKVIVAPYPRGAHSNVRLQVAPLEIFDLAADPLERNNLGDYLEVPSGLLGALTGRALRFARPAEADEDPNADFPNVPLEQLRALGYLD